MDSIFLRILNMSLTASYVILLVLLARLILKRAPKVFSYALWIVVLFRLICPFSFESIFSAIPQSVPTVTAPPRSYDVVFPAAGTSEWQEIIYQADHSALPQTPVWTAYDILAVIWLVGIAVLLIYSVVSLLRLRSRLVGSVKWRGNIYLADHIPSPFVLGIIRPKIYLPSTIGEDERKYIILHERTHIRRFDYIFKLLAFFALTVHWFNPLVWLAYVLHIKDMEMSCDESVMRHMDADIRQKYSASLLSFAAGRRIIAGTPLAFGESDTKSRIKNVMSYKKPALWVAVTSAILVVLICVACVSDRSPEDAVSTEKYTLNASYSLGSNGDDLSQTLFSFDAVISGAKEDIENIDAYEVLINTDHLNLLIENGPYSSNTEDDYLKITGSILFDTVGMTKEMINAAELVEGIKIIDKDKKEYVLSFKPNSKNIESTPDVEPEDIFYQLMPWDSSHELELLEFPNIKFRWSPSDLTAIEPAGERVLFSGMPIWNVYVTDLNGDALPEFCATISLGSGIVDTRIIVFDYANDAHHELADRMVYDYSLSLEDGLLFVTQSEYTGGKTLAKGELAIIDGNLTAAGIDRTIPEIDPQLVPPTTPISLPSPFYIKGLDFEVSNIAEWHWEVYQDDGGEDVDLLIVHYLPGAELIIKDPGMSDPQYAADGQPHSQWGLMYSDTSGVRIDEDIKTVSITEELTGIYSLESSLYVVKFIPYEA